MNISNQTQFVDVDIASQMVPASKVAFVTLDNSLEHALLILTQSGYSAIPVLNGFGVVGIINTTLIIQTILGVNGYDVDKLGQLTVGQAMSRDVPRVRVTQPFMKAFELSIHWNFVCVEDDAGAFLGIVTRKNVLATAYRHLRRRQV